MLHCIPTLRGGGAERQVKLIARELVQKEIDVAVFSRFTPDDLEELSAAGVTCFPIRSKGNHNPALVLEYWQALRKFQPNVVQSWLGQMDLLCGSIPRNGARWVLSERCSALCYTKTGAYPSPLKNRLRAALGSRSDIVVANSPSGLAVWNAARAQMIIPNGVDLGAVEAAPAGSYLQREPYRGRKIVLAVGRLAAQKQMNVLVAATELIRATVPEVLLVILGEGPDRSELEKQITNAGLQEHVKLEGFRTDVPTWLKSAQVFASASLFEGQPNAVLEAAAAGTPMVLSEIPEHRDVIHDGAVFVQIGHAEQFARAIANLLEKPELANRLTEAAKKRVAGSSVDLVSQAYANLYRQLSAERPNC